jgi:hypothetical protein
MLSFVLIILATVVWLASVATVVSFLAMWAVTGRFSLNGLLLVVTAASCMFGLMAAWYSRM